MVALSSVTVDVHEVNYSKYPRHKPFDLFLVTGVILWH